MTDDVTLKPSQEDKDIAAKFISPADGDFPELCQLFAKHRLASTPPPASELADELERLLERVQEDNRPLPWVVHTGSSYRRIASLPTRENPCSFPDGNVLHGITQRSDGHPDLSMGEDDLEALVGIINRVPSILAALRTPVASPPTDERTEQQIVADEQGAFYAGWEAWRKWLGPSAAGYPTEEQAAWELYAIEAGAYKTTPADPAVSRASTGEDGR